MQFCYISSNLPAILYLTVTTASLADSLLSHIFVDRILSAGDRCLNIKNTVIGDEAVEVVAEDEVELEVAQQSTFTSKS
jgi:hypothetical protein